MFRLTFLFFLVPVLCIIAPPERRLQYPTNAIVKDQSSSESSESLEVIPSTDDDDVGLKGPIPPIDPTMAAEIILDVQKVFLDEPIPVSRAEVNVRPEKIHFQLYNKKHPKRPVEINSTNLNEVDPTLKAVFITHGWITPSWKLWIREMKNAFLKADDVNVFVVDWDAYAFLPYSQSFKAVPKVGKVVADFVMSLNHVRNYSLSNFHLIGHSLGAQISGFAGQNIRKTNSQKLARITGLDAAGPLFEKHLLPTPDDNHLTYKDADFVDAIHTNGKLAGFGYIAAYGDIDFFPNGGNDQKGCDLMAIPTDINELIEKFELVACSHQRSIAYFTESISSLKFVGKECGSYTKYKLGLCKFAQTANMGEHVNYEQQGSFYLTTNRHSPYARG